MPNVLIFTPTWKTSPGKNAIRPECQESIDAQLAGFAGGVDWCIGTDNPYPVGSHRNVLHQYQNARELFLSDGRYDALLTVEHDNVLPDSEALQRMYDTAADVVYAPYQLRHGAFVLNTWRYENERTLGMSLSNYPNELAHFRREGVGRICGCGMGCTLFRRHVVEALPFHGGGGHQWAPDIPFAYDALAAGYVSMGRFDVPVGHYEGDVLLDAYGSGVTMKYRALQTVNALADNEFIALVAGQVYELRPKMASDLARTAFIEPVIEEREYAETAMLETPETAMLPKPKSKRVK